jgi:hypothetical protein
VTAVARRTDDCLADTVVERFRPDGVHVRAYLATCLMWNGQRYPPAPARLTVDDAVRLVADPVWGVRMSAVLVLDGAARYPGGPVNKTSNHRHCCTRSRKAVCERRS